MWINGWDPAGDSWDLTGLSGWMAGAPIQRGVTPIPNVGGVMPNSQYNVEPRQIAVTMEKDLTAITDRDAAVIALEDRLRGLLWVRFDDAPTRVVRCIATPVTVEPMAEVTVFSVAAIRVRFTFICYDGASYDTEPRVLALATTPTEVPLGTLTSRAIIYWGGAWSSGVSRTLTFRDHGGTPRSVSTFTAPTGLSLGSTDYLELDSESFYVTKVTSAGVRTASESWGAGVVGLSPGIFDPAFQDRDAGRYATVEVSAGTAQVVYRRVYAL